MAKGLHRRTSRKTINEVMYEIGYSDVSEGSFGKAFREDFRKIIGLSPVEYPTGPLDKWKYNSRCEILNSQ